MTTPIASESGHWYDGKTGEARYTIIGANGKERATTLRDARKFGYVPSVTTVSKIMDKPALGTWLQKQVLMAALTLTRTTEETDEQWIDRIMEDSKAQGKAAAERGTAVHGAIERAIQGDAQSEYLTHIQGVTDALKAIGIDLYAGKPERSFAHSDGFGGKIDWSDTTTVIDFKTKDAIGDKAGEDFVYDEHPMQLGAYAYGLGIVAPRCVNVFIGVNDAKVVIHEHDAVSVERGLRMFKLALALWKEKNNY